MIEMYFERWTADVNQKAEFQVRSGLILDKLAKNFNIEATESDLDVKLDEMVAQSGMKRDDIAHRHVAQRVEAGAVGAVRVHHAASASSSGRIDEASRRGRRRATRM